MKTNIRSFITWFSFVAIIAFLPFQFMIFTDKSLMNIWGNIGYASSIAGVIAFFYNKFIWKINPLEKTPRLAKAYSGSMHSTYNGGKTIGIKANIKQTFFGVTLTLTTNESRSDTLASEIVYENGSYYLYYTFINTPKASVRDGSPMHYGTCKLVLDNTRYITGNYWTDRHTDGDVTMAAM